MGRRDQPGAKGAGDDAAARRTFVALPLAQLMPPITRPAFRARSPASAELIADWESIVGKRLAEQTLPRKLSRGQLTIACSGPVGMELQHAAAALIERINVYTGAKLVERLRFVQAPVGGGRPVAAVHRVLTHRPVTGMDPGPLSDALAALGSRLKE